LLGLVDKKTNTNIVLMYYVLQLKPYIIMFTALLIIVYYLVSCRTVASRKNIP